MKKLLLVLAIPLLMGAGCASEKDGKTKYQDCFDSCQIDFTTAKTVQECQMICVEKYK